MSCCRCNGCHVCARVATTIQVGDAPSCFILVSGMAHAPSDPKELRSSKLNTSLQALPQVNVRLCRDLQGAKEPASALNIGQIVQGQVHRHTAPRVTFGSSDNPLELRPVRGLHISLGRAAVVPQVAKTVEDGPTSSASPKFSLIRTSSITPSAQVTISPMFCDNSRQLWWTRVGGVGSSA